MGNPIKPRGPQASLGTPIDKLISPQPIGAPTPVAGYRMPPAAAPGRALIAARSPVRAVAPNTPRMAGPRAGVTRGLALSEGGKVKGKPVAKSPMKKSPPKPAPRKPSGRGR